MSSEEDVVRQRILEYLRARVAFETASYRRWEAAPTGDVGARAAVAEREDQLFQAHRAQYLAPEVMSGAIASPRGTVAPESVRWRSVKVVGDRATVGTVETDPTTGDDYEYRYSLERRDGRWLLSDRRMRDPLYPTRWIKVAF